jgi:hypothetical protein
MVGLGIGIPFLRITDGGVVIPFNWGTATAQNWGTSTTETWG